MSLILDALRKSEHQRQRQVGPGLATVPESHARQMPAAWVLVLGGLLILNMLVLAALLLTDGRSEPTAAASPGAAEGPPESRSTARDERPYESSPLPGPMVLQPTPPRGEVRSLTTEVGGPVSTPAPDPADPPATPRPAVSTAARAPAPPPAQRANEDARLPRFNDLVVRGELNVPHMHLDIHVFSGSAAERFVFINMRRYNEGQATQEGPTVERIVNDGVVMDYQGQRFFLSRD
jgi:general secretion pathway protein B